MEEGRGRTKSRSLCEIMQSSASFSVGEAALCFRCIRQLMSILNDKRIATGQYAMCLYMSSYVCNRAASPRISANQGRRSMCKDMQEVCGSCRIGLLGI